jgi:membrane-associated phospholipid phosphatase
MEPVLSVETTVLVILVLLGPALVLGILFAVAVRRHPGIDPSSPHVASVVAHDLERAEPRSRFTWPSRMDPKTETGLLLGLALVVIVVGGVILGVLAMLVRTNSGLLHFDRSIAPWGEEHMTTAAQRTLDFVTSFGSTEVIVGFAIGVFVIEMIRRPSRWLPVFLVAVTIGQTLMSTFVKELVDRVRPTANPIAHTLGPSFPSGHTTGAAACFAAFALVLGRGRSRNVQSILAGAAVFIALAVAASRVLLGVHWLSDVIGGLALGWGWFALCSIAFGGRLLRLGAPVEAATRVSEEATRTSASDAPDPVHRA